MSTSYSATFQPIPQLNDPLASLRPGGTSSERIKGDCPTCGSHHTFHVGRLVMWCDNSTAQVIDDIGGSWHATKDNRTGMGNGYYWRDAAPDRNETEDQAKARRDREAILIGQREIREREAAAAEAKELAERLDDRGRDEAYRAAWKPLYRADHKDLMRRLEAIGDVAARDTIALLEDLRILGHNGIGEAAQYLISNHVAGMVLGGQVRYTGDIKYKWENQIGKSSKRINGLKPIGVWEPLHPAKVEAIVAVEGFNKGLMSQVLSNAAGRNWLVLGLGGCAFATAEELQSAIAHYKALYKVPVLVAFDSDWAINPGVQRAAVAALKSDRFDGVLTIPYTHNGPKAIDDLSLEAIAALEPISIEAAKVLIDGPQSVIHYYDAKDSASLRAALEPQPGVLTIDVSPTGSGKSYNADKLIRMRAMQALRTRYASDNYRNPSNEGLEELLEVQGRHTGLARRNGKVVIAAPGEAIIEPSNCYQAATIASLNQSGALGDTSVAEVVCAGCPLLGKCASGVGMTEDGKGYGYIHGLKNSKKDHRLSPTMLPADHDESWAIGPFATILDEMETLKGRLTRTIALDKAGIANATHKLGTEAPKWQPLFSAIQEAGRWGMDPEEIAKRIEHLTIEDCDTAIALTAPDLSALTEIEGVAIADLDASTKKRFAGQRSKEVIANAIPGFAEAVRAIKQGKGAAAVVHGQIIFQINTGFAEALLLRGATLLTATPDLALIKAHFGDRYRLVSSQPEAKTENLKTVVIKGLGRCGASRSDYCSRTIPLVINALENQLGEGHTIGVLDHKRYLAKLSEHLIKGTKFGDSKGSNLFVDAGVTDLILVGPFAPSIAAMRLEYATALAHGMTLSFDEFYRQIMDTHMVQGLGRLRANRRPGEMLTAWIIDDKYEGADAEITVEQLLGDDATGKHSTIVRVAKAIKQLPEASYRAIARLAGVTAATVSRLYEVACNFVSYTGLADVLDRLVDQHDEGEIDEETLDATIAAIVQEYAIPEAEEPDEEHTEVYTFEAALE